jgi:ketosteroid isomerase-like protein
VDIAFGAMSTGADDETVLVLDCDGWQMTVPRDELPSGIDVETLPVTSV